VLTKVLLITDVAFWDKSSGSQCRIFELVKYLIAISELTIVFVGTADKERITSSKDFSTRLFFLNNQEVLSAREYSDGFEKFLRGKQFDVWIVEYIHNAYFLDCAPEGILTILDAHDIISERNKKFRNYNCDQLVFDIDEHSEFEIMDLFDHVIFLTRNDFLYAREKLNEGKILVCPHPVPARKPVLTREVKNIGFIGSEYLPNVDAMEYLIQNCWTAIQKKYPHLTLNIYGNVAKGLQKFSNYRGVILHGFIKDLDKAYEQIDILVNPVRFGAGLKIKNVEAIANGVPLITTLHGASGLERILNKGFLIAEHPEDFLKCMSSLIEDYSLRERISDEAVSYAQNNFGVEKCFYDLGQLLAS